MKALEPVGGTNNNYSEEIYLNGETAFYMRDYKLALQCFEKAVALKPSSSIYLLARGKAKGILLDWKGAISDLEKAIALDYGNWSAFQNLGICKMNVGQFEEALDNFKQSLKIKPDQFETYGYIAEILNETGRIEEAYDNCTLAVENYPTSNLFATKALLSYKLRRYEESLSDANKSIALDNLNARGYAHRSNTLWALGIGERAIDDLITAIGLAPHNADFYESLSAYSYEFYGTSEASICLLRIALLLEPDNSVFLFGLGNYYSSWVRVKNSIAEKFRPIFRMFKINIGEYCSEIAFENRHKIAKGFYSSAFANMFSILRTDLKSLDSNIRLSVFVGNNDYLFDILENNVLFFTDVNEFPDKVSDCPLLNPINQIDLAVNLTYENVRIRSLSGLSKQDELCNSLSMWDRFAHGHKGLCYTLLIPKSWFIENGVYVGKVRYSDKQIHLKAESPEQVIQDGLYIKNSGYSDENEFRLAKFGTFERSAGIKLPFQLNTSSESIRIESIYLGAHMDEKNTEKVMKLTFDKGIDLYQMAIIQNGKLGCIEIAQQEKSSKTPK